MSKEFILKRGFDNGEYRIIIDRLSTSDLDGWVKFKSNEDGFDEYCREEEFSIYQEIERKKLLTDK